MVCVSFRLHLDPFMDDSGHVVMLNLVISSQEDIYLKGIYGLCVVVFLLQTHYNVH